MSATPRFSVSEITTVHQTFAQDVETYAAAGCDGMGVWEFKLPAGEDSESVARLRDSGLVATTCIPGTFSIFPVPLEGGATDPPARVEEYCSAVRRFAPFEPEVVLAVTGKPPAGWDPGEARRFLVDGLRRACRVAAEHGLTIGVEPLHRELYANWTMIGTIPETIDLLDEVDEPNAKLLYDVYHLWDTEGVIEDTVRHGSRIVGSVHICDWRRETRSDFDRVLPGDGVIDLPALLGALEAGGAAAWFDLEIFSDDGTFTDQPLDDSLWKLDPADVVGRGKAGFERAWAARHAPA
ncbi:MAG: sugar phosphate isomerase/epimerase family protein [Gaiella sp.]